MSCGSAIGSRRWRFLLALAMSAFAADFGVVVAQSTQAAPVVLRAIQVEGSNDRLIITLTADGPISGRLQQIGGDSTRMFVDLPGVRPQVDAVTPINRGPILRIRVALNSAQPPVTRVVLDVSKVSPARTERGATDHELRIIIGEETSPAGAAHSASPASPAKVDVADWRWCTDVAERLSALIEGQLPSTSQGEMHAATTAWAALEREIEQRRISQPFQSIQFTLVQSARLGRIAAAERQARAFEQATAALAGARLLLNTARDRLELLR